MTSTPPPPSPTNPMDPSGSEPRGSPARLPITGVMALACMALGALVLVGWALDIGVLKSVATTFVTMKANTALGFVLSGLALWPLRRPTVAPGVGAKRAARTVAGVVVALGAVSLGEYLFSWNAGIDQLLFREVADAVGTSSPGRMAPNDAIALVAAGLALLLLLRGAFWRAPGRLFVKSTTGIVLGIGLMSLLGYTSDIEIGYRWGGLTGGALHAGAGFVALGVGLFAALWRGERTSWAIGKGATAAFAVALGMTFVLIGTAYHATHEMEELAGRVALTNEIRFRDSDLLSTVKDVETASRGFALTGQDSYLEPYTSAVARMAVTITALRRLTVEQPRAQQQLDTITPLIAARMDVAREVIKARRLRGERAAFDIVRLGRGRVLMDSIRGHLAALDATEERLVVETQVASDAATRRVYFVMPLAGVFALIVLPLVLLKLNREIVARGLAVAAARSNAERFRATFEQTAIGFALVAPSGRFLRVNSKLCEIVAYSREELEERTFQDVTHPDDLAKDEALVQQVLEDRISDYTLEKRYIRKDGSVVWVSLTVSLVRHAGSEPVYFIAAIKDITERREQAATIAASYERFRLAAAAAHDTIWDWDLATDEIWRSVDLPRRYGYTDESVSTGAWWIAHIHVGDRERVQHEIDTALGSSSAFWESAYRFLGTSGKVAHIRSRGFIVRADDGTATRLIGSTSDVTEQVEMQSHLRQVERMETVGRLAGGIAHDFNNLLGVIIGTADLAALEQAASSSTHKDLTLIRDTATRAAELTRQLLAFSRKQVLQPKVVNLNAVVADTEPMLRRLIGEHVVLAVRPAAALGSVFVDPTQMQQVVLNLAINARDAMPDGGTLTIATEDAMLDEAYCKAHEGAHVGPHVMLSVRDTGTGMDEATRQRIFEPFFTTKEVGKGTGLGLATVYGIVKQSNGYIWVYSEPGQGTIFKVYFPRDFSQASEQAPATLPDARAEGQRTVLVVDDDAFIQRLAGRMLEQLGYTVLVATDGASTMDVLARHAGAINLVLTDVVMPGMSGPALAERVRASYPNAKILFTSGYVADADGLNNAVGAGTFFIGKPYSLNDLSHKLKEVLGS